MSTSVFAWLLIRHIIAAGVVAWILLWMCRVISAKDRPLGLIVQLGLAARLIVGAALFWVSYLQWAPLSSLHTRDGFWALAPDARSYFLWAAVGALDGLHAIDFSGASPAFVATLALWMRLIGVTPTAVVLLNAMLSVLACLIVTSVLLQNPSVASRRAARLVVSALSVSPALILFAAQGLKDQFFITLLVLLAAGVLLWLQVPRSGPPRAVQRTFFGIALAAAAVLLIAGIRAYLAFIAIGALALSLIADLIVSPGRRGVRALVAASGLVLVWMAFAVGAGPYYPIYGGKAAEALNASTGGHLPREVTRTIAYGFGPTVAINAPGISQGIEASREGFVRSGGDTNLGRDSASGQAPTAPRLTIVAQRTLQGLAVMFVPVSLLRATGIVEFSGGRGLLFVTDLDSIFNLASLIGVWYLVRKARIPRDRAAYAVFALVLAIVSTVLMAYVVTNFGTLFRLRLMALAPFWLSLLVFASRPEPVTGLTGAA